jgi:hypothetical protein
MFQVNLQKKSIFLPAVAKNCFAVLLLEFRFAKLHAGIQNTPGGVKRLVANPPRFEQ